MSKQVVESAAAQDPLISYATSIGWAYLSRDEATTLRRGEAGTLFYQTLRDKLIDLNPGLVTTDNVDPIVNRIEGVRNNIEGNSEVLAWLRGERGIFDEENRQHRNVRVLEFDRVNSNTFHVTDEWQFTNGRHKNRADVVFLINGIPVAIVETKSPKKREGIEIGFTQIRRYHAETPELVTAPQVFDVTHVLDFFYGVTWNLDRKNLFNWKDEEPGNFERKVKRFFARERFLKMLREWIIFFKRDDELHKIVLRQHQTRAVEKVVERAMDPEKRRGLIWHSQGSGKTFTMMSAAKQILELPGKPTVLMLVDRTELEGQLFNNLSSAGFEPERARDKKHLAELLRSDFRGMVVSMIHKFEAADADLCTRDNVFVLVDEAHRTTGGNLGNYLVAALPNATLIGFTGTPIDSIEYGTGTFKVFGGDDAKGYLDKYSIAESIRDGATVKLHYQLAESGLRVPPEQLEKEFFALTESEGVSDVDDLNRILEKAVRLKAFLKAPDRVTAIASFVAKHFRENVEPMGYKAFLVGVDREACALYKKALDELLPADSSAVIYSSSHNDPESLARHHLTESDEKKTRKAFLKPGENPMILIVTEKLLTGFDAPILYAMYLDKPMRDHALLQAIARVNRPFENDSGHEKPAGLIVDFIGIFERLEKALRFDSDYVGSVIDSIDVLKKRYRLLMTEPARRFLPLLDGPIGDKAIERIVEAFAEVEPRDEFLLFFNELSNLHEILSPDVYLRPYLDDYARLAEIREIIRSQVARPSISYSELRSKTESLVREKIEAFGPEVKNPSIEIDAGTIDRLRAKGITKATVINLGRALTGSTPGTSHDPYLASIGERAEKVVEAYEERHIDTQQAMLEFGSIIDEKLDAERARRESGLGPNSFAIYWSIRTLGIANPKNLADRADAIFERFPNFRYDAAALRSLKAGLYKIFLPAVGKDRMVDLVDRILRLSRE